MAQSKKKLRKTQAEYGAEYGVDERTIRNWIKRGYPLDDYEECRRREEGQKNSASAKREAAKVVFETKDLTDEQLENPRTQAEGKHFQLVLICRRLSFNNKKERELFALKSDVIQKVRAMRQAEWSELRAVFERELPPICEGLSAADIQRANADALTRIAKSYQAKAEKCAG